MRIEELNGIGKKRAELFKKLGVFSVGELLNFYPRTYEDWSEITDIADVEDGATVCVRASVHSAFQSGFTKTGKYIAKTIVTDDTGACELIYFNNKYIDRMLINGKTYRFFGKASNNFGNVSMIAPTFSPDNGASEVRPIYNLTSGLNNNTVVNALKQAIKLMPEEINDPLPEKIREKFSLCGLKYAIENIHFPENMKALETARKRLVVEELLVLNLGLRSLKSHKRRENMNAIKEDCSAEFEKLLPFKLTNAQKNAVKDCINDIKNPEITLNRLVQGDVGSGKTVVAGSVCYSMIKNGFQTAFMAPTEILAEQHYNSFKEIFKDIDINIALLTGSLKPSEKERVRESLKNGETDLVIGTHALITDKTEFSNLGLVVTDEQHRFGVAQRAKLLSKGNSPHLLVMSATPIPRTLGLIIFGDLDISIIDELPPGRQEIDTLLIGSDKRVRALNFIKKEIARGRQAYIVCPLVEEGEGDLASAEEYAAELMLNYFSDIPVGILHGKMKASEKEEVMRDFADNKIKLLVATTVIEVGIDVKNATIMMIENAERFGLSQLHQLRGRVGRGSEKSYCILVSDSTTENSNERLKTMCTTRDGFKIADADLKLRGPGDFFGSRQHGLPELKISSLADTKNLSLSQKIADYVMKDSHNLRDDAYRGLKAEINRLFRTTGDSTLN
jgi:ATP-dependent DNA helicase RecG